MNFIIFTKDGKTYFASSTGVINFVNPPLFMRFRILDMASDSTIVTYLNRDIIKQMILIEDEAKWKELIQQLKDNMQEEKEPKEKETNKK